MRSFDCNKNITCENCEIQITKPNLVRHKKSCSAGTLYFNQSLNFFRISRAEKNYHVTKKHSKATAIIVHECKICDNGLHSLYLLREHKRKELG